MNAAVGLMDGLGLDSNRCIHVIPDKSEEAALLSFLDLSTTRVIAGKMHSQSPILKTKGRSATW